MNLLSYAELKKRQKVHCLRQAEIPVGHVISLLLPTQRWGGNGYACFASPAQRIPGEPLRQAPPDRWWVVDAYSGHLLQYALWDVLPYALGMQWDTVTLSPPTSSLQALQQMMQRLEQLLENVAEPFFLNKPDPPGLRSELRSSLHSYIPAPLLPQYRELVPDLFSWLEAQT
jgi:hypothetical protein